MQGITRDRRSSIIIDALSLFYRARSLALSPLPFRYFHDASKASLSLSVSDQAVYSS